MSRPSRNVEALVAKLEALQFIARDREIYIVGRVR